jgi:hypothetical protein
MRYIEHGSTYTQGYHLIFLYVSRNVLVSRYIMLKIGISDLRSKKFKISTKIINILSDVLFKNSMQNI